MAVEFKSQLKKDSWMRHTCCVSTVIERLGAFLSTCVHANSSVRFRGSWYYICCFFFKVTASGEGMETEGGMTVASDESLPRVVAGLSWPMKLLQQGKISWENGVRPRKSESMLFLKSSLA